MGKTNYEQQRDANVKRVQDVFKSLGIDVLSQQVRDDISIKEKGKAKRVVSDKPSSDNDNEYDPTSDIDNQSDSDDDYDDDLTNEVHTQVR
jgi:hypothetical protein